MFVFKYFWRVGLVGWAELFVSIVAGILGLRRKLSEKGGREEEEEEEGEGRVG